MNQDPIFSPSEFVDVFNQSIEYSFPFVTVEGELSNFRVSKNRWVYFDLKDDEATVKCFGTVYMLPGPLEDGMLVRIVCSPRLHPQFNFSLNVQSITPVGEGQLAKAAELLFKKLEAEGLFLVERKREVPYPPESICLITSLGSAAHADFMKITAERWPALKISTIDSLVQGANAPEQIVESIDKANKSGINYDAIVLIRGGGSAEDLAAFSDERVVRTISASRIPTCVAIGHEIDESLAELACDLRASTPSNLAELLVPDKQTEQNWLRNSKMQTSLALGSVIKRAKDYLSNANNLINSRMTRMFSIENERLNSYSERFNLLNPRTILKRGYAMVKDKNGKLITKGANLQKGESVDIIFTDTSRRAEII